MTPSASVTSLVMAAMAAMAFVAGHAEAQPPGFNYDESKVGSYTLPDPLVCADGTKVADAKTWRGKRRPEILELFRTHVYGRSPDRPPRLVYERGAIDAKALGGKATRQEIRLFLDGRKDGLRMTLLLYVPNGAAQPVPAFLGMNFDGNHTVSPDPGITITPQWAWDDKAKTERLVTPAEDTRGSSRSRWPLETILDRGYAVATICASRRGARLRGGLEARPARRARQGRREHAVEGRRLGCRGRVGLGHEPRARLPRNRQGGGREARRADRPLAPRQGGALGRGRGRAIRPRHLERLRRGRGGTGPPRLRRDGRADQHGVPPLVLRQLQEVQRGRPRAAGGPAHTPRPDRAAPALRGQRGGGPWADPRGEFLSATHAEPVYRLFGKIGLGVTEMAASQPPRRRDDRLPRSHRQARRDRLRLGALPGLRRSARPGSGDEGASGAGPPARCPWRSRRRRGRHLRDSVDPLASTGTWHAGADASGVPEQ